MFGKENKVDAFSVFCTDTVKIIPLNYAVLRKKGCVLFTLTFLKKYLKKIIRRQIPVAHYSMFS